MNRLTKVRVQRKGEVFTVLADFVSPTGKRIRKFGFKARGREQFQKDLDLYLRAHGVPESAERVGGM